MQLLMMEWAVLTCMEAWHEENRKECREQRTVRTGTQRGNQQNRDLEKLSIACGPGLRLVLPQALYDKQMH
jgi:hypothetical protein